MVHICWDKFFVQDHTRQKEGRTVVSESPGGGAAAGRAIPLRKLHTLQSCLPANLVLGKGTVPVSKLTGLGLPLKDTLFFECHRGNVSCVRWWCLPYSWQCSPVTVKAM